MASKDKAYVAKVTTSTRGQIEFMTHDLDVLLLYLEKHGLVEVCIEREKCQSTANMLTHS